jgi:hypothetical protein
MDPILLLLVPYAIGTLLGLHWGFQKGIREGSEHTIDMLMEKRFLKWKKGREGIIEFIEVD